MRHKNSLTLLAASLALSAVVSLAFAQDPKSKPDASMDMKMSKTGDQDYDFAMMMREHHQKALPMARMENQGRQGP